MKPWHIALGAGLLTSGALIYGLLPDFSRDAEREADRIARAYGAWHIGHYYGLTPSRTQGIERLARAVGV